MSSVIVTGGIQIFQFFSFLISILLVICWLMCWLFHERKKRGRYIGKINGSLLVQLIYKTGKINRFIAFLIYNVDKHFLHITNAFICKVMKMILPEECCSYHGHHTRAGQNCVITPYLAPICCHKNFCHTNQKDMLSPWCLLLRSLILETLQRIKVILMTILLIQYCLCLKTTSAWSLLQRILVCSNRKMISQPKYRWR